MLRYTTTKPLSILTVLYLLLRRRVNSSWHLDHQHMWSRYPTGLPYQTVAPVSSRFIATRIPRVMRLYVYPFIFVSTLIDECFASLACFMTRCLSKLATSVSTIALTWQFRAFFWYISEADSVISYLSTHIGNTFSVSVRRESPFPVTGHSSVSTSFNENCFVRGVVGNIFHVDVDWTNAILVAIYALVIRGMSTANACNLLAIHSWSLPANEIS